MNQGELALRLPVYQKHSNSSWQMSTPSSPWSETCDKHQETLIASNTWSPFKMSTPRAILPFPQGKFLPAGRNVSDAVHIITLIPKHCWHSLASGARASQEQSQQHRWTSFTTAGFSHYLPLGNMPRAPALSDVGHLQMWRPPSWLEAGNRLAISKAASRSLLLIALKRKAIKLGADTDSHPVWIGQRGGA